MDTKTKRSQADKVRRRLTTLLSAEGFARTKTSLWISGSGPVTQFVHMHLFSFEPGFCVHFGVRVLNDPFPALGLNGPSSHGAPYNLQFDDTEESIVRCAFEASRYYADVGRSWFGRWREPQRLVDDPSSPLSPEARSALHQAMRTGADQAYLRASNRLLGAA